MMDMVEVGVQKERTLDEIFKEIMGDSYVLARVLSELVQEVRGKDLEYIRRCLPIEEGGRTVIKGNPEIPAKGHHVTMDNFIQMRIPATGKVRVLLNIEGQRERSPGYSIIDRALYYAASIIHEQKGTYFDHDNYSDIVKTYSIWIMMDPRKDMKNTISRYYVQGEYDSRYSSDRPLVRSDKMEIVIVNIGNKDDCPETTMGMLNSLFSSDITDHEKAERLSEVYNIPDTEYIFDRLRGLNMTIDEEMHRGWKREGVQEAIDSREVVPADVIVNHSLNSVSILVSGGMDLQKALDLCAPKEIRDEVQKRIKERGINSFE
ncbi:hypothetical protein PED39_04810 [Methanomassiliicoccales archaeon LGM-RCC1]|nr:hypothetical protein PED39_04810 [Methanomassiliicoccales archaeon LGM-RCC1]